MQRSVQYKVHGGDHNAVELDCHGRSFQVQDVAAKILAKIRDVSSDYLGREGETGGGHGPRLLQ